MEGMKEWGGMGRMNRFVCQNSNEQAEHAAKGTHNQNTRYIYTLLTYPLVHSHRVLVLSLCKQNLAMLAGGLDGADLFNVSLFNRNVVLLPLFPTGFWTCKYEAYA